MARETSRSWHFCHFVLSHHLFFFFFSYKQYIKKTPKSLILTPNCWKIVVKFSRPERGVRGDLLSFPTSLFSLLFLHPSLNSSTPSIWDNISPPQWEGFARVQLNESMSEEGGYFTECHFFFPSLGIFPRSPSDFSHQRASRTPALILDQRAVASRWPQTLGEKT